MYVCKVMGLYYVQLFLGKNCKFICHIYETNHYDGNVKVTK